MWFLDGILPGWLPTGGGGPPSCVGWSRGITGTHEVSDVGDGALDAVEVTRINTDQPRPGEPVRLETTTGDHPSNGDRLALQQLGGLLDRDKRMQLKTPLRAWSN